MYMSSNLKRAIIQHQSDAAMCFRNVELWKSALEVASDTQRARCLDRVNRWQHEAMVSAMSARLLMGMND